MDSDTDVVKRFKQAVESCSQVASSITDTCLARRSLLVHNEVAQKLATNLLLAPIGPDGCSSSRAAKAKDSHSLSIYAVGLHSAGACMPDGRHSSVYVEREHLYESARSGGLQIADQDDSELRLYLALFNFAYGNLFGRQNTFVHALLHDEIGSHVLELPMVARDDAQTGPNVKRKTMNGGVDLETLSLGSLLPLISGDVHKKNPPHERLVKAIIESMKDSELLQVPEQQDALGHRVVKLAKDNCVEHTLIRDGHSCADLIQKEHGQFETLLLSLFGKDGAKDEHKHKKREDLEHIVRMLQLFLLYKEFCGDHFYVFAPAVDGDLRVCVTLGVNRPLKTGEQTAIFDAVQGLAGVLRVQEASRNPGTQQSRAMQDLLGTRVTRRLENKIKEWDGMSFDAPVLHGLVQYLRFCECVSEVAVHEGKPLGFDIVVGDGLFASERLSRVSRMPDLKVDACESTFQSSDPLPCWKVAELAEQSNTEVKVTPDEVLPSLLIGNFSFMQSPGIVLQGTREGYLIYLAKLLDETLAPPQLTEECDCYVLRIQKGGDVQVFFRGVMVLWRRGGQYIVPGKYGQKYITSLATKLHEKCGIESDRAEALAKVAWSLSADRRGGGSFVVAQNVEGEILDKCAYSMSKVFPFAEGAPLLDGPDHEVLTQLAVQDGAVIIDAHTGKVYGRRQVLPAVAMQWEMKLQEWKTKWPDWYKILRWGTRHHTALAFAAAAQENGSGSVVVITVSSDGEIHVFCDGLPDKGLTYPDGN
jgi:hypothetical protein